MVVEESQQAVFAAKGRRRLHLSVLEITFIAAMLLVLAMTSLDAMDGRNIGKDNALDIAKLQGQQELMASLNK